MRNKSETLAATIESIKSRIAGGRPIDVIVEQVAQLQQQHQDLVHEMRILRAKLSLYDGMVHEIESSYKGRSDANIDAGMPLRRADGFYEIEYERDGSAYRWTGPEAEFRFDLHLDRSLPLVFRLLLGTRSSGEKATVRAYADGAEIPLLKQKRTGGNCFVGVLFPRAAAGLSRISFIPDELFSPSQMDPKLSDTRVLGVIFKSISVLPADQDDLTTYASHFGVSLS